MHDTPPTSSKYGKTCAFGGQGWSPDHPAQLPLFLILV